MTDYQIVETMITYGGSFAQKLAEAWRCADEHNQQRLKDAFPDYWLQYRLMAARREQRAAERSA